MYLLITLNAKFIIHFGSITSKPWLSGSAMVFTICIGSVRLVRTKCISLKKEECPFS